MLSQDPEPEVDILGNIDCFTVKELKAELRKRNAPLKGKKQDLYERLEAFIKNDNFALDVEIEEVVEPNFFIPDSDNFRDITSNTVLPPLTGKHVEVYMQMFSAKAAVCTGEAMYRGKFLSFVRHQFYEDVHFLHGRVHAQMHRKLTYIVNIKVDKMGVITASHCECAAGDGGSAHCKHVVVVLLGAEDMFRTGTYITRASCTSKLQAFNRPSQTYQGTPLKACDLGTSRTTSINFDPRPDHLKNLDVKSRIFNLIAGFKSSMPLKHLTKPANPYAVDADHDYCKEEGQRLTQYLRAIRHLPDAITDDMIMAIELQTRGQANNPLWKTMKELLMTASNFHAICTVQGEEASKNLAMRLLNPTFFVSKETQHGILNEGPAVDLFAARYYQDEMKPTECGLFIMKSWPFLGASPDRLVAESRVIEVKCPYSARDLPINQFTVPELIEVNGSLQLKPESSWMYQIQGQLAVTGKKYCFLVVHTYAETIAIDISRDDAFIDEMMEKLENFYYDFFLPTLLNQHYYRMYYDIFS